MAHTFGVSVLMGSKAIGFFRPIHTVVAAVVAAAAALTTMVVLILTPQNKKKFGPMALVANMERILKVMMTRSQSTKKPMTTQPPIPTTTL
eukprot:scaffold22577_cov122-Cylindrotheca_fusiformis.AAC.43